MVSGVGGDYRYVLPMLSCALPARTNYLFFTTRQLRYRRWHQDKAQQTNGLAAGNGRREIRARRSRGWWRTTLSRLRCPFLAVIHSFLFLLARPFMIYSVPPARSPAFLSPSPAVLIAFSLPLFRPWVSRILLSSPPTYDFLVLAATVNAVPKVCFSMAVKSFRHTPSLQTSSPRLLVPLNNKCIKQSRARRVKSGSFEGEGGKR